MERALLSVGLDIGTSTTQMVLSRLTVENKASAFAVPDLAITDREIIYRSAIHFTPLQSDTVIDADAIQAIVDEEYRKAGIEKSAIETGAVIITGETARKDNAKQVLSALSGYAGEFVVATAGPDLEGILAARGAGCDEYSRAHDTAVLNFDIGGGTANACLFEQGRCVDTGCLNVGGRLIKLDESHRITYVSPVLDGLTTLSVGQTVTEAELQPVADLLTKALEEAAGLRPRTELSQRLTTNRLPAVPAGSPVLSFSGGVADMIYTETPPPWDAFGDIGVILGRTIARSPLLQGPHIRPKETIRATVVGAGSHATTLSGSTIAYEGVDFPLKNLPVLSLTAEETAGTPQEVAQTVEKKLRWFWDDGEPSPVVLAFPGQHSPDFQTIERLAGGLLSGLAPLQQAGLPLLVAVTADMAKALGQAMLCRMAQPRHLLCMDGLTMETGMYLDIGSPVGSALPVVVKTLLFDR